MVRHLCSALFHPTRSKHKSEKGEAFAPEFIAEIKVFIRKCFAPTAKNRLLQETFMS
jgi:hypothetical protein